MEAHERFAALVETFATVPGVQLPDGRRRFGSAALKAGGSIFAMLTDDRLVVKLPAERVESLIASGDGAAFDASKGRPMKEWLTVVDDDDWVPLAQEALEYAEARGLRFR